MRDQQVVPLPGNECRSFTLPGLIEAVTSGHLDAELPHLAQVVGARLALLAANRAAVARARLHIGDRVHIGHSVKPAYLHEQPAVVVGWHGSEVILQLDTPIGRFESGRIRCPPESLEPYP
jgi:hypothetical protein